MKKGNLSNVPAPYVYIDGASLYFKSKFGRSPKLLYIKKLIALLREANVVIYLDKKGKLSAKDLEKSPFAYTEIVVMKQDKFKRFLKRNRLNVFVSLDRAKNFVGQSYLIEATASEIISHIYNEGEGYVSR